MGFIDNITGKLHETLDKELREAHVQDQQEIASLEKSDDSGKKPLKRIALTDPNLTTQYGGGGYGLFKPRFSHISFKTLKEMSLRDPIVAAIIQTRINQVAGFSKPQPSRYDTGFKIMPIDPKTDVEKGSAEEEEIETIKQYVLNTGQLDDYRESQDRMTFDTWLKLVARDRLTYGAAAIETMRDLAGKIYAFLPVPTETVFYANKALDDANIKAMATMNKPTYFIGPERAMEQEEIKERDKNRQGEFEYVQVIEGRVVEGFTREELLYKQGNPQNFIDTNGYCIGELEMATTTITSHLQAENYNKLFFCLSPSSLIRTDAGSLQIDKAHQKFGDSTINVWTGTQFHKGKVYQTQQLEECETHLKSGQILRTSGEHWFYILREGDTEPRFINQRNIKVGDFVLVSPNGYEATGDCPRKVYNTDLSTSHPMYHEWNSSEVKEDLFEVLGWLAGDGHIGAFDDKRRMRPAQLFYHHTKELKIRQNHFATLQKYGIKCHLKEHPVSKVNVERHGHATSPRIFIFDVSFKRWLFDLGFGASPNKGIPDVLFNMPKSYRAAFLRGLFSADGYLHKNKMGYATPHLCAKDEATRSGAASLLLSLGVRSILAKQTIGGERVVTGLRIQDVGAFKRDIGFIQDYKNQYEARDFRNIDRNDLITRSLSQAIANALIDKVPVYDGEQRNGIRTHLLRVIAGKSRLSRQNARSLCADYGLDQFLDTLSFCQVPVVATRNTGNVVQMYDIEILDPIHRFTLDGVVVHNTHGFAARGLLHIKGDVTPAQLQAFRAQWYAQVSGNANSWRTPIIAGVDQVDWVQLSATNREMEYGAYIDHIIRILCSLFQIGPMEIGMDYLSRGSGQSSLGESNNEWKIQESQDRGLRPLLSWFESILNQDILPQAFPGFEDKYKFCFVGLDAESKEQELERQKAELSLHTAVDDIRKELDKDPVLGGKVILNPEYIGFLMRTHTIGEIREMLLGYPGDSKNPLFDYIPDGPYMENRTQLLAPAGAVDENGNPIESPPGGDGDGEAVPAEGEIPEEAAPPDGEGFEVAPEVEEAVQLYLSEHPEIVEKSLVKSIDPLKVNARIDRLRGQYLNVYNEIQKQMMKEILEGVKKEIVGEEKADDGDRPQSDK